jgi:hypothetical protein
MKLRSDYAAVIAASVWLASPTANAVVVSFTDQATFLGATGATSATGPLPALGATGTVSTTIGSVTFSPGPGATNLIFGPPPDWTTRLAGNELAISGVEDLNLQTASPVSALGFNFVEPQSDPNVNETFIDSTFTLSLFLGAAPVGSAVFTPPNDVASFMGLSSTLLFDRVEIRETIGGNENEFFGEVFTRVGPLPGPGGSVPEPSTLALLLGALGLLAKRRQRSLRD